MSDGDIYLDDYQLLNVVASGNSTTVWEAVEKGASQRLAIKLLLPEAFEDSALRASLKHEAKVAEKLEHPNLVRFHELVMNKKNGYIVMEFFRAPNVKAQISSDLVGVQARIRKLVESLCQALIYLHDRGWVHYDIKPDNVLLNKASELRLIDFSLATRIKGSLGMMLSGKQRVAKGTPSYIAPETLLKQAPTPQTDMYSLGILIYEALTGATPFRGTSQSEVLKKHVGTKPDAPSAINTNVTPELDRLVLRLLAKKPAERHASMGEVFAEFRALKPFKEDVLELAKRREEEAEKKFQEGLNKSRSIDSRADAMRSELFRTDPELARKMELERQAERQKQKPAAKPAAASQQQSAPPAQSTPGVAPQQQFSVYQQPPYSQPQPGQHPPQPYPQFDYGQAGQYPFPPQYGYPMPGQMPGPFPPQGQYPPPGGYPQPQPGMPPGQQPPQQGPPPGQPQQPPPSLGSQQQPPQQQPPQQQPAQQQPPQQQPAAPPPQQPVQQQGGPQQQPPQRENLPLMDELPPVD